MLISLYIENYALIDKLNIEFGPGFNVITGETGAGKSIIVGALSLILGERASTELIKTGRQKALLEAVFDIKGREIAGYENDDILIIGRELQLNGRNICKLNDRIVTQNKLREISRYLFDIHGQHQHQLLIDPVNHLAILDQFIDLNAKLETIKAFDIYDKLKKEYELLQRSRDMKQEEKDFYKYQYEELTAARLKPGEYLEIKQERARLDNFNEIAETFKDINSSINETMSNLQRNRNLLQKILVKESSLKSLSEQAESLEIMFEDFRENAGQYESSLEYDPQRQEELVDRLDLYNTLKRKHLKQLPPEADPGELLLQKQAEIKALLDNIEFSEERLLELEKECRLAEEKYLQAAQALSLLRKKTAKELAGKIEISLRDLKMAKVQFDILISKKEFYTAEGYDNAEFLISPNPGEPLKPLTKIASGGEISRVMLAIKDVLIDRDIVPAMVFDEIDTGIGGDTANAIAKKIAAIADKHQIICITHLAQIAAVADRHLMVIKNTEQETTAVDVRLLQEAEREHEIARMLSGRITDTTKAHARELLGA